MSQSTYHLCIDRVVPARHKPRAAELAIKANPKNKPALPSRLLPGVSANPAKISFFVGKQWPKGKTLKVAFMDGTPTQRQKAKQMATEWSQYGDIHFKFNGGASSEIRISFTYEPGSSWSAIGTDCLSTETFPKDQPTMNFGWLEDDTDDKEWRRVVVHEFGHAIGAVHEHQVPKGGIKWNLQKVYAYFSGPPNNWSKDEIDFNIVQKYSVSQLNGTSFDKASIMLYQFPAEFILAPASLRKSGTALNTDLSKGDKSFVAKMYGKP
jgi:hypothetical protein